MGVIKYLCCVIFLVASTKLSFAQFIYRDTGQPATQAMLREIHRKAVSVKREFKENGITIPVAQREVRLEMAAGESAPLVAEPVQAS